MRILFLGDVVGRAGRDQVVTLLPGLKRDLDVDFTIVNGENAAHGFGLTDKIAADLHEAGADCITTGNHVWDQREIIPYIAQDTRLIRPINYPSGTPGRGVTILPARGGQKVLVVNVMGRLFMDPLDDPFLALERVFETHRLGSSVAAVVVDMHAEATSEKLAIGHFCDGRASLVVGTHTHVPTADTQILDGGTAYQTDAGMCGDYGGIIGFKKEAPIARFTRKMPTERLAPGDGEASLCGVFVETDDQTGLARSVAPIRVAGRLNADLPAA